MNDLINVFIMNSENNIPFGIDTERVLGRNHISGKIDTSKYTVIPVLARSAYEMWSATEFESKNKGSYQIWMTSPFGLILIYENEPSAMVTLDLPQEEDRIEISDLIGITPIDYTRELGKPSKVLKTGTPRGLGPLDWTNFLVSYVTQLGQDYGYTNLFMNTGLDMLERVTKNYRGSFTDHEQIMPLTIGGAVKRYDRNAQRFGFNLFDPLIGVPFKGLLLDKKLSYLEELSYELIEFQVNSQHCDVLDAELKIPFLLRPYPKNAVWYKRI